MSIKANVRSPYYLKFSDTNLTKVTVNLFVYSGTVTTDKGNILYNLTNDVISGTDYVVFEVSDFVRDFITHSFNGTYTATPQWFTAEATLYNGETVIRTETVDRLAFDGYTKFKDGVNHEGNRDELITTRTIRVPQGQTYYIPIFAEDVVSVTEYTFADNTLTTAASFWNEENRNWEINADYWAVSASSTSQVVNETAVLSNTKVQYVPVSSTVDRITISTSGNTYDVLNDEQVCTKYGWNKATFINKHGVLQDLYLTGKRTDSLDFNSKNYKAGTVNFGTMNYDLNGGQSERINVSSGRSYAINTGFMHEDEMSAVEELIMSEAVWITTEAGTTTKVIPLNTNLEVQNHLNNKLINVELSFEEASDNLNTVL